MNDSTGQQPGPLGYQGPQPPVPPAASGWEAAQPLTGTTGPALLAPQGYKDATAAWLLWAFLAGFGAHDFYLRRPGPGAAKIVLTVVGWATVWLIVGVLPLIAVFVWWVVDATTMNQRVRQLNAAIHHHNRVVGAIR